MRAIILYALLVIIGTVVAAVAGLFFGNPIIGVAVFFALFLANFYLSWVITWTIVERVKKAQRRWRILNQR